MNVTMTENLRTTWRPATSITWDAGRLGFETYFQHVTKFRPAVSALVEQSGGKQLIKICDVSHPRTPEKIVEVVESTLNQHILVNSGTRLTFCLKRICDVSNLTISFFAHDGTQFNGAVQHRLNQPE